MTTQTPTQIPTQTPTADSWDRLVSTALVGTARRPVPDTPDLPATPATGGAEALLDRAALAAVRRTAGYAPHTAVPVTPDGGEEAPEVDADATRRLETILGHRPELLREWLELAVADGRRARPASAPGLLDQGARYSRLRPLVAAAVGGRGRWLARFKPEWEYVAAEALPGDRFREEDWTDGTFYDRGRALTALRAADPGAGRERLAAVWSDTTRVEQRRRLLETLTVGLASADADFLDRVLDDRGANVRGLALSLLTSLPESAHADRLRGYVREHARLGDRGELVVDDVGTGRADILRDLALVAPKSGPELRADGSERTWALVTHAPLDVWGDLFGAGPSGILVRAERSAEPKLRDAFVNAVTVQGDADWARAALRSIGTRLARHLSERGRRQTVVQPEALLEPLPPEERLDPVLRGFDDRDALFDVATLLKVVRGPWADELSERVVRLLYGSGPEGHGRGGYGHLCELAAERLPPELHIRFSDQPPSEGADADAYLRLRDTLRFRLDMQREL